MSVKKLVILTVSVVLILLGLVRMSTSDNISDWQLQNCIEGCRVTYDPNRRLSEYSNCVETCKRMHPEAARDAYDPGRWPAIPF